VIHHAACEARSFAVKHQGFFDQVDHVSEVVEPFKIGLQQILPELDVFFIQRVCLQVAVEFL
jgi:hypothetical protein